jgi:hypothetical protein
MAWMWALTKVPWKTILVHGPAIVDAARSYYATTRRAAERDEAGDRGAGGPDALRHAVQRLEEREVQQAALFADLARQVQDMATAIEALRRRFVLALWGAGLAIVMGVVAIILALRG